MSMRSGLERALEALPALLASVAIGLASSGAGAETGDPAEADRGAGAGIVESSAGDALDEEYDEYAADSVDPLVEEERINVPDEITVTAAKREQAIQDVPISVTALSGQMLSDRGITEFQELQQFVPNLAILPTTDTRSTSIRIRGIGSVGTNAGIDPSVGVFIDGVYQGRAGMSVGDLLDIERVEVLRGPQGTLYGKNTAAGAINILTKRPNYDLDAFAEVVVGSYDLTEFRGTINMPIVEDRLAGRFAAFIVNRDGFATNRFDGSDVNDANKWGLRGKLVWDVTETFSLLLSGDYSREDTRSFVADIITYTHPTNPSWGSPPGIFPIFPDLAATTGIPLPTPVDGKDLIVGANTPPSNVVDVGGVSLDMLWDVRDHQLRWLNAWRTYDSDSQFDGDFSIYNAVLQFTDVHLDQFSSELTLTSPSGERLEYQAGLFFFHSKMNTVDKLAVLEDWIDAGVIPFPNSEENNVNDSDHETFSYAAYGEGGYMIMQDLLQLVGGLRITYEEKSRTGTSISTVKVLDAPPIFGPDQTRDGVRRVTNLQGRIILKVYPFERTSFDFFDQFMAYFSFSNGFKSGGFNQVRTPVATTAPTDEFNDEHSLNYELAIRTTSFDNRLTFNVTGFFTDYQDFQSQTFSGSSITVKNAGSLYSYGIEADINYLPPVENLVMGAQIGWNITEYQEFEQAENTVEGFYTCFANPPVPPAQALEFCSTQNLAGGRLDNAPRLTATIFVQYARELGLANLEWFTRGDYTYTSMVYLAQDLDPNLLQPQTHLLNLRLGLRPVDRLWEIEVWATNVADQRWFVTGFDVPVLSGYAAVLAPPRQFGFTMRFTF